MRRIRAWLLGIVAATSGCGTPLDLTPAQTHAISTEIHKSLYYDYARRHNLGLGAHLDGKPQLVTTHSGQGTLAALPTRIDLRPYCPPVYDQGPFSSCTGFAVAKGLGEYLLKKRGEWRALSANHLYVAAKHAFLTAQDRRHGGYTYSNANDFFVDNGTSIAGALAALEMGGAVAEANFPYPPQARWADYWRSTHLPFKAEAPYSMLADSLSPYFELGGYTIENGKVRYNRLDTVLRIKLAQPIVSLEAMRGSLAKGMPVVCGVRVYESFYSDAVRATGDVPMPNPTDRHLGGHAMLCVGYDDLSRRLIFRNSWGAGWGDAGYCFVPYEALSRGMVLDCWTVQEL